MKFFYLFAITFFCSIHVYAQSHHATGSADKPSTHGMLIFGTEKIYASHLPLFHTPHNYQVLLQLELDDKSKQLFIADKQLNQQALTYTIEPEKFILPDKINSRGSFSASLYRGHFERGGIKIADSVLVKIASVIYFRKLNTDVQKNNKTEFILFGNNKEQFVVHCITAAPDFEQIIQVDAAKLLANNNSLFRLITFDKEQNTPVGVSGNIIETETRENIVLLKQVYLEFDDLKN